MARFRRVWNLDSFTLNTEEQQLIARIRNLPEHQQNLVYDIVEQFAIEQEIWLN